MILSGNNIWIIIGWLLGIRIDIKCFVSPANLLYINTLSLRKVSGKTIEINSSEIQSCCLNDSRHEFSQFLHADYDFLQRIRHQFLLTTVTKSQQSRLMSSSLHKLTKSTVIHNLKFRHISVPVEINTGNPTQPASLCHVLSGFVLVQDSVVFSG